jgi:hypothetical protein
MKNFCSDAKSGLRLSAYGLVIVLAGVYLSCGPALQEPTVLNLTLSESNIQQTDTGSSETINATLQVSNFSQPLSETISKDETYIFLQSEERPAEGSVSVQGSRTILIEGIAKTWLGGLDKGEYQVGVKVTTETEEVRQLDMATINIQ